MSADTVIDPERRFWLASASLVGGAGVAASAVPFVASLTPSERARAGRRGRGRSVGAATGRVAHGGVARQAGLRIASITRHAGRAGAARRVARRPGIAALRAARQRKKRHAIATLRDRRDQSLLHHLGCIPTFRPTAGAADIGADWPGGFFCPCHGSKIDFAGRVFKNVPAPTNLTVPPYRFATDTQLVLGADAVA